MNDFKLLVDSTEFYSDLQKTILSSKNKIDMQFLTFEADSIGIKLANLLIKKSKQGIKIRLIIDKFNDFMINDNFILAPKALFLGYLGEHFKTKDLFKKMRQAGIEIIRTGKSIIPIFYTNHKKLIVIDDVAYLGGFNISEHNFSWHDFMFRIKGKLVEEIKKDFDLTWNNKEKNYQKNIGEDLLISDLPGKDSLIYDLLLSRIKDAKKSIFIQSPYFSGKRIMKLLESKANQGIKVTIIMPLNNNRLYYRPLTRYYAHKLKKINLRFYINFNGMTHAKVIMIDDSLFFGSSNLGEQSSHLCKEIMVVTKNKKAISQTIDKLIKKDIKDSIKITDISKFELYKGKLMDIFQNRILTTMIRRSN